MSQFWLDDDDDEPVVPLSQQSQDFSQSNNNNNNKFYCDNCGSTGCYYDATTGRDVCQECFTQSQQINSASQEAEDLMDYDDVMGLAAKTAGGNLVMTRKPRNSRATANKISKRMPLEVLDQSVALPDLETCLDGIQCILKSSARIMARHLLQLKTAPDDDLEESVVGTVGQLWIGYLRAFSDGAEHYGKLYPELRFSMRECFFSPSHNTMIKRHLAWKAMQILQEKEDDAAKESQIAGSEQREEAPLTSSCSRKSPLSADSSTSSDSSGETEGDGDKQGKGKDDCGSDDDKPVPKSSQHLKLNNRKRKRQRVKAKTPIRSEVVNRVLRINNITSRQGYKEAALKLPPSMDFCATLLWLAVCKSGVTSFEFSQWIATGALPLLNAFDRLLTSQQRAKLQPIKSFFRRHVAPSPSYLEGSATVLAVACRMKTRDSFIAKPWHRDEVVFWSTQTLALVVAKLVANAGMDQGVLNRTLALINLPVPAGKQAKELSIMLPTPLPATMVKEEITRSEDILAVIAIAALMDPNYASWSYHRSQCPPMPYNECHFDLLSSSSPSTSSSCSLTKYLDFVETNVLDPTSSGGSMVWDGFEDLEAAGNILPEKHSGFYNDEYSSNDDESTTNKEPTIKPSTVLAGGRFRATIQRGRRGHEQVQDGEHLYASKQAAASCQWIGSSSSNSIKLEHPRRTLLIDFLAYTAQARVGRIRKTMDLFLSVLCGSSATAIDATHSNPTPNNPI